MAVSPPEETEAGFEKFPGGSALHDPGPGDPVARAASVSPPDDLDRLDEVPERQQEREVPEDRRAQAPGRAVRSDDRQAEQALPGASRPGVPRQEEEDEDDLGRTEAEREPAGRVRVGQEDPEDDDGRQQERASRQEDEVDPERRRPRPEPLAGDPQGVEPRDPGGKSLVEAVRSAPVSLPLPDRAFFREFRRLPKAELHLHLEGSIREATFLRLAARQGAGTDLPGPHPFRSLRRPGSAAEFFRCYRTVCRLLSSPSDYALLARDLVARLRRERIGYAEVYVSPAVVERVGLPWPPVRDALEDVFAAHEGAGHGRVAVLLDSVRQWGPEAAERVLDLQRRHPWARARGFGLGGEELSVPAREFRRVYARARGMGLGTVVHAGEWGGADSVAEAVRWLAPVRVAHGFRAADDPALVRLLARGGVTLDVCPTSNLRTGALPPGVPHPALTLARAGVRVSVGTDDPGLFGTTLRAEFARLARQGATDAELRALLRTGRAAALPPA